MSFIELCRKFVATESTAVSGNKEIAQLAGELCESIGLHVEFQMESLDGIERCNLIARPHQTIPNKELMLQTHLDTADPSNYIYWTKTSGNPFNASIYGDDMYGLGVANAKLDFLCKIKAAEKYTNQVFTKKPFVLVGTFGFESGMAGALKLIRRKKISADQAFIGCPTGNQLASSGPGNAIVEIVVPFSNEEKEYHRKHDSMESSYTQSKMFTGKAAHAAQPHLGENAINKMLDYLSNLPEGIAVMEIEGGVSPTSVPSYSVLEIDIVDEFENSVINKLKKINKALKSFESEFNKFPDDGFTPPHSTMNVGQIKTYEEFISLQGTCRITPSVPKETYELWIKKLRMACEKSGATFKIVDYKPPHFVNTQSEFVKYSQEVLSELGLNTSLLTNQVQTEANIFSRLGIDSLVFGAGQLDGNSHAPDEKVSISQLKQSIEFYEKIIERFCI